MKWQIPMAKLKKFAKAYNIGVMGILEKDYRTGNACKDSRPAYIS